MILIKKIIYFSLSYCNEQDLEFVRGANDFSSCDYYPSFNAFPGASFFWGFGWLSWRLMGAFMSYLSCPYEAAKYCCFCLGKKNGMLISRGIHYGLVWRISVFFLFSCECFQPQRGWSLLLRLKTKFCCFQTVLVQIVTQLSCTWFIPFEKQTLECLFVSFLSQTNWSFCYCKFKRCLS